MEVGGRLPTAIALQKAFIKILSKHLAANKKVSFAFRQKSSLVPIMNPNPVEILQLKSCSLTVSMVKTSEKSRAINC